jgi:RNA polymerase sigma factor (sigma-70 family)
MFFISDSPGPIKLQKSIKFVCFKNKWESATFFRRACPIELMSSGQKDFNTSEEVLLIKRVLSGDMNAYKSIIVQHQKLVAGMVYKMVQQKEDREDLCQEIFLKIYEKLGTFRFQSKLSTWIANIAFNHCVNFLKKKKALFLNDLYIDKESEAESIAEDYIPELTSHEKPPDQQMANKELRFYLEKSMDCLTLIQKTMIQLFHQHEFSLEEIAIITTLPVNTVKSHLFRARAILKIEMLKYVNH